LAASLVHVFYAVFSHFVDSHSHLGGRDTDLPGLTVVAALLFMIGAAAPRPPEEAKGHVSEPDTRRRPQVGGRR
jgi:hypothetical protein